MIALVRPWRGNASAHDAYSRIAASLGLFAGHPADSETSGDRFYARLAHPRARPSRHWRAARSASGAAILLHGWIDNAAELARILATATEDAAALYGAAVDRWGDSADRHVIGSYAAIVDSPDGSVRLSRSPWSSPPLAFVNDADAALVASVSRAIFAAGYPEQLRRDKLARFILMRHDRDDESLFEGIRQVPQGSIVHLTPGSTRIDRWYHPRDLAPIRLRDDRDYVERARELLDEAVACALAHCSRPGVELSGGLDSPIVTERILAALPASQRLTSFTFHPMDEADLGSRKDEDDERPYVRAFAAMHPRLDPVFVDNRGADHDSRAREMFLAAGKACPSLVLHMPRHGIMQAARDHGCDWLLGADYGNINFSNEGAWALPEFLATGHWRQAWRLARRFSSATRPTWWQVLAMGVMPHLSPSARAAVRRVLGRSPRGHPFGNRLLRADCLERYSSPDSMNPEDRDDEFIASRRQWLDDTYFGVGLGAEFSLALEHVFGVQRRDVSLYRPLTEFCLSIPTNQLVRDGEERWLAIRMAEGRIPEKQRLRRGGAIHNADWHLRMTPHIAEMRKAVLAMGQQPELADIIDVEAGLALLDSWPERAPDAASADQEYFSNLQYYLPATLMVSRYVDFVSGRNSAGVAP